MLRHIFPLRRSVYLDYNATTPVSRQVRKTMSRILKYYWGNPSASYSQGKMAAQVLERSRKAMADAIHAHPHEIYFTGSATESNNTVIKTLCHQFYPAKKKIISTPTEHPSVINTLEFVRSQGIIVEYCPVDHVGRVSPVVIEKLIDDDTFLICCHLANNEIGTIQDIGEISRIAKKHNILVFSDCVQAFGKIPMNVKELGVDYATFSAHKLYGPKGIGALYARISSPLEPFIHGGHQEEGIRAGTESVHNIAGFGAACKEVENLLKHTIRYVELKEHLIRKIREIRPNIIIQSPEADCLPNTVSITFPGTGSREIMRMLDYHGISVSSGSACSSQLQQPSHVLKAIGLSDEATEETVRISFGKYTTHRDILYMVKVLKSYYLKKR